MAMFSSSGSDAERTTSPSTRSGGKDAGLSIVAKGMCVTGQLDTDGVVKIEGKVEGSIRAERQVLVAKGGVVQGDIFTREAVIGGEVRGGILADERVEVQVSSVINGDITTQRIIIQEGGEVNGHVRMGNPQALGQGLGTTTSGAAKKSRGLEKETADVVGEAQPTEQARAY